MKGTKTIVRTTEADQRALSVQQFDNYLEQKASLMCNTAVREVAALKTNIMHGIVFAVLCLVKL